MVTVEQHYCPKRCHEEELLDIPSRYVIGYGYAYVQMSLFCCNIFSKW